MKTFKIVLKQQDTELTTEFQLNENHANDMGMIVGTALNNINRKLTLSKVLGARLLKLNKPVDLIISADGVNIDTRLLDAGVIGAKKEFKTTFVPSATPARQIIFARKVWAATQLLLQNIEIKHIDQIIGTKTEKAILFIQEDKKEVVALPGEGGEKVLAVLEDMPAAPKVPAITVPGSKKRVKKEVVNIEQPQA